MNDHPLEELDAGLRTAVEIWRAGEVGPDEISAALGRIAARPPRPEQGRRSFQRLPPGWLPAVVAAGLACLLLWWAPAAWAEAAEVMAQQAEVAPAGQALRAAWRSVLIVHVVFVMGAFLPWSVAWVLLESGSALRLLGVQRLHALAATLAPWLAGSGCLLWLIGTVIGAFWAKGVLGRYWGWEPVEIGSLATVLVGLAWTGLAWKWRADRGVLSAVMAALALWLQCDIWWGYLATVRGTNIHLVPLFLLVALLCMLALQSAVWLDQRRAAG